MEIELIRNATLLLRTRAGVILVDPTMLGGIGAAGSIPNTPNPRPNPIVELPRPAAEIVAEAEMVLVTHTHRDHWDATAIEILPKSLPLFGQPEDEDRFRAAGFLNVHPVADQAVWPGRKDLPAHMTRTGGQHGTGEIGQRMAPVSGFVLRIPGEPSIYIAGDTIWCTEVQAALETHAPDAVIVNSGAARFLEGDPITMTAEDVAQVAGLAPQAAMIAVHLEAMNHCLLTREALAAQLARQGMAGRVRIPKDGEVISL